MNNLPNKRFFKYDVVLSFAHQDQKIAMQLYDELNKKRLETYSYLKVDQWTKNLHNITLETYAEKTTSVVVFVSENYVSNFWTNEEWETIQLAVLERKIKLVFLIRLDDSPLDGLVDAELYENWNDNPKQLATKIKAKFGIMYLSSKTVVNLILVITLFAVIGYFLLKFFYL